MYGEFDNLVDIYGVAQTFPPCPKSFKQLQVEGYIDIPFGKPDIEYLLRITGRAEIVNTTIINTPVSVSYEGQVLTRLALAVKGEAKLKVEYSSDDNTQSMQEVHIKELFTTYIILDESFDSDIDLIVIPYIEDIHVRLINKRRLFKSMMLLIDAVPQDLKS